MASSGLVGGHGSASHNYSFKIVLLGEGCVGKTSLILRYVENKFNDKHFSTLQVRNQHTFYSTIVLLFVCFFL